MPSARADVPGGGPAARPGPVRTCIGCRSRDVQSELLRVVAVLSEGGSPAVAALHPDPARRSPGRGAWLHPVADCLERAEKRRAFGRALRLRCGTDASRVRAWIVARAELHDAADPVPGPAATEETESGFDADEHPMSTQQ